jgi:hypothetical protein
MKKYPFFLVLAALYPVLSLYQLNMSEVNIMYITRPLLISMVFMGILFGIFWLVLRNSQKSAIVSTILFLVLTSYGALYNITKGISIGGFILGRHRVLLPIVILLIAVTFWLVITRMRPPYSISIQSFNIAAFTLIILSIVQIGIKFDQIKFPLRATTNSPVATSQTADQKPDIYYFLLDSYPRADFIKKEMNYDNSPFINELEKRGFYVANCSLSNYSSTRLSLSSSLNMKYFSDLGVTVSTVDDRDENKLDPFIIHSQVRSDFEKAGYKTVAFETGYPFTEWGDADFFYRSNTNPITMPIMTAFEEMVIENTGLSAALQNKSVRSFLGLTFPYYEKWSREHFIIDQVKKVPDLPGPKLTFVHLVTTHHPYVFTSDGGILTDDRYYRLDGLPVNDEFSIRGFQYELEFTNKFMIDVIDSILTKSKIPPVIIVQGDHGVRAPGRISIFNALLIPNGDTKLYQSISPVNSFRVIEDNILGKKLDLLPDNSYFSLYKTPFVFEPAKKIDPCLMQ